MNPVWEYKTLKLSTESGFFTGTDFDTEALEQHLNTLGAEGWELSSSFSIEMYRGESKFVVAVLKRLKP
jgi:hypothetical protein